MAFTKNQTEDRSELTTWLWLGKNRHSLQGSDQGTGFSPEKTGTLV